MEHLVTLKEYSQSDVVELSSYERTLISSRCRNKLRISRPIEGEGYSVTSNSYVGVYNIGRHKIVVEPKVQVVSVFRMLCQAYELVFFDQTYTQYENIEDLFEYLMSIFQNKVGRLVNNGLHQDYVEQNDDLGFITGRININALARRNWCKNKINCDYDLYQSDVIENQIIRHTLEKLLNMQFKNMEIRRSLEITKRYFNNITLRPITLMDLSKVQYTVLNAHYEPIHSFCRMVLELVGIHEREGVYRFNAYSLDMNLLFERYIGQLIKKGLEECDVVLQDSQHLDYEEKINIEPDIVIYKDDAPMLVLDTKYKIDMNTSSSDVFQIFSYMNKLNVNGVLLYPAYEIEEATHTFGDKKLFIKSFNLNNLDHSECKLVEWVKEIIDEN